MTSGHAYLDNEDVIKILREFRLDIDDDEDEQTINKVLMVIKKKNIWPYLYKFCIFYPNQSIPLFLTMLAAEITMDKSVQDQILHEPFWTDPDSIDLDTFFDDENKRLFFRIFWFLDLVLAPQ